ncbi:MAG TPA: hypothetical protein VI636_06280 [Candidatus Angelobacter sp.]
MISVSRVAKYAALLICLCLAVPVAFSQTTDQDSTSKPAQDAASQAAQDSTSQPVQDSTSQPAQVAEAQPTQDSTSQPPQVASRPAQGSTQTSQNRTSSPCDPTLTAGPPGADPCLQAQNQQMADPTAPEVKPVSATYTPSLNGGPPIQVEQPRHMRYFYGLAMTQGFDSNVAGPFSNIDSWTSTYEGYLAAAWRFTRNYVIVQQDTTYTHFGSHLLEGHSYNQTSLLATGDLDPNIGWIFEAHSFEGNNTLTELSPLPGIVVNGITVTSPGAATAGLNEGFIWGTDVVSTLNWKPDQRDIFSFRAENANQQFLDLGLHDNLTTLGLQYQRALTQETYLGAYGLERHETGTIDCQSAGFGLLGSTKPTDRWYLQGSGGPEYDTGGCRRHQGFELHFAAVYKVRPTAWMYATANRQFSSGFVPNSTWEDDAGVGLSKRITRRLTFDLSGGYARGYTGGFLTPSTAAYKGFYGQAQFIQRLSKSFDFAATYRRYDQSISGQSVHRNIVLFTLRWSPANHDARRSAMYPYSSVEQANESRSGREE